MKTFFCIPIVLAYNLYATQQNPFQQSQTFNKLTPLIEINDLLDKPLPIDKSPDSTQISYVSLPQIFGIKKSVTPPLTTTLDKLLNSFKDKTQNEAFDLIESFFKQQSIQHNIFKNELENSLIATNRIGSFTHNIAFFLELDGQKSLSTQSVQMLSLFATIISNTQNTDCKIILLLSTHNNSSIASEYLADQCEKDYKFDFVFSGNGFKKTSRYDLDYFNVFKKKCVYLQCYCDKLHTRFLKNYVYKSKLPEINLIPTQSPVQTTDYHKSQCETASILEQIIINIKAKLNDSCHISYAIEKARSNTIAKLSIYPYKSDFINYISIFKQQQSNYLLLGFCECTYYNFNNDYLKYINDITSSLVNFRYVSKTTEHPNNIWAKVGVNVDFTSSSVEHTELLLKELQKFFTKILSK